MRFCKHCSEPLVSSNRYNSCNTCRNGVQRYGLNKLQQLELLEEQSGQCAICYIPLKLFSGSSGGYIDHCHETGRIRGILCLPCNTTLGYIENKAIDLKAVHYYLCP